MEVNKVAIMNFLSFVKSFKQICFMIKAKLKKLKKAILLILFIILTIKLIFAENNFKNEKDLLCSITLQKDHYDVMSYFLINYFNGEKMVYIIKQSESFEWIFDKDNYEEVNLEIMLKKFLSSLSKEDSNYIFKQVISLKSNSCFFENKFKIPFEYTLVNKGYNPKLKNIDYKNEKEKFSLEIYEYPIVYLSMPIFNEDKNIAFIYFIYLRSPKWGKAGWALLEKELEYWRTIKVQAVVAF